MNYFEENPEFNYFFLLYPECVVYQNFFDQPDGSIPVLKDFETINADSVFKKWKLDEKGRFWATIGSWFHLTKSIIIEDEFCKEISRKALKSYWWKEDFECITKPLEQLPTDEEKYGYILRKLIDLESFWTREGHRVGNRGNDDKIIEYLKTEVQFYERKFAALGISSKSELIYQSIGGKSNPIDMGRSKPKTSDSEVPKRLIDYLDTDDNEQSLGYLHDQFSGHKGQTIAYMIFALKSIHALKSHDLMNLYKAIRTEFGNIGTYESVRDVQQPNQTRPKQYKKFNGILLKIAQNIHLPPYK
jgi:hypothetical protein